jgi:hypothetical protein
LVVCALIKYPSERVSGFIHFWACEDLCQRVPACRGQSVDAVNLSQRAIYDLSEWVGSGSKLIFATFFEEKNL